MHILTYQNMTASKKKKTGFPFYTIKLKVTTGFQAPSFLLNFSAAFWENDWNLAILSLS